MNQISLLYNVKSQICDYFDPSILDKCKKKGAKFVFKLNSTNNYTSVKDSRQSNRFHS